MIRPSSTPSTSLGDVSFFLELPRCLYTHPRGRRVCNVSCLNVRTSVSPWCQAPGFLENVTARGEQLRSGLRTALEGSAHLREVRGSGLLVGVQLDVPAGPLVGACRDAGLLVLTAGAGDVLRLLPPLVVSAEEVDQAVSVIADAVKKL